MILSSGVCCFAIKPNTDEVYILLGQERGRWSDFAGRPNNKNEKDTHVAAREFYEESMGCVRINDNASTIFNFQRSLLNDEFVARIRIPVRFRDRQADVRGDIICYFINVPWQPFIPIHFMLTQMFLHQLRSPYHPAMSGQMQRRVRPAFLEKDRLQWFSLEYLSNHMIQKKNTMVLRPSFMQVLSIILKDVFDITGRH